MVWADASIGGPDHRDVDAARAQRQRDISAPSEVAAAGSGGSLDRKINRKSNTAALNLVDQITNLK